MSDKIRQKLSDAQRRGADHIDGCQLTRDCFGRLDRFALKVLDAQGKVLLRCELCWCDYVEAVQFWEGTKPANRSL